MCRIRFPGWLSSLLGLAMPPCARRSWPHEAVKDFSLGWVNSQCLDSTRLNVLPVESHGSRNGAGEDFLGPT